jgi:D-proline reductase (dithiol) PrdB
VSAISYYLEAEGIMTTGISLVREITESLRPPRALWVSFPLGRPLGKPGDADFQHRVIRHALRLLERERGPVLEDCPLELAAADTEAAPACPISFPPPAPDGEWQSGLAEELQLLKPWYELGRRRRGRTTVGVCKSTIDEILAELGRWLDHKDSELPDLRWFKYAIEDARAYYSEALMAQPGDYPAGQVQKLIWSQTVLGCLPVSWPRGGLCGNRNSVVPAWAL